MLKYSSRGASKVKAAAKLADVDKEGLSSKEHSIPRQQPPSQAKTMIRPSVNTVKTFAVDESDEDIEKMPLEESATTFYNHMTQSRLLDAAEGGDEATMKLLLEEGATADSKDHLGRTILSYAAERGKEAIAKLLLENGAAADSKDDLGRTILSYAAERGKEAIAKLLLENSAAADSQNDLGQTPLSYAARRGEEAIAKLLLKNGAAADSKDNLGRTILSYAAERGIAKLLLKNGAAADSKYWGRTILSYAAERGKEAIAKLLLENGAAADSKDNLGRTILSYAAERGKETIAKLLLENGAAADTKDDLNQTPLSYAARRGEKATVKLLLENSAAADSKDHLGRTPLSYAARRGEEAIAKLLLENGAAADSKDNLGRTILSYAAERDIAKLLLENGAAADSKDNLGRTILSYAAERGEKAIVKLLLENGAAADSEDDLGRTPLSYAAAKGDSQAVVKLLLENGAAANSKDDLGRTILSYAAQRGNEAIAKLLLENGAAADTKDDLGRTILSYAAERGKEAIAKLLLENGAAAADSEYRWSQIMNLPMPDREEIVCRTDHRDILKSIGDDAFLTNKKTLKQEDNAIQVINAFSTPKEPHQTTHPTYLSNVVEQEESRFNHPVETARQGVMHSNEHLSSSSEDDTEEWQYEDGPDTVSASQASNELDNTNPSFLAPQSVVDIDIMNPGAWIYNMKNAEREVFERSYIFHKTAQSRDNQRDSHARLLQPIAGSVKFDTILLPEGCPIAHLNDVWSHLVQQSETFNRHMAYPQHYVKKLILSRNIIINLCEQVETLNQTIKLPIPGFNFFVSKREHILENVTVQLCQLTMFIQHIHDLLSHCLGEPLGIYRGLPLYNPSFDRIPFDIDGAGNFATRDSGSDDLVLEASNVLEFTRRWFCIAQILDIGLVSYTSAHLEDGEDHAAYLSLQEDYALDLVIDKGRFSPIALGCMQSLLSGSKVWVYSSHNIEDIQPAWISIRENDLDNIWGPMWKLIPEDGAKTGHYYALGSGAIGVTANCVHLLDGMTVEPDEVICHFEPSIDCIGHSLLPIEDLDHGRLLIGAAGLNINIECNGINQVEGLRGLKTRPHGTSEDGSYLNSSTYNITAGWSGTSISFARQYLLRQGTTRKDRVIHRWKFQPDAQNPSQLLLRCGLEVSLCTRNARRRQLLHLMGSPSLLKSLQNFPWEDARCGNEVQIAFQNGNFEDFSRLYKDPKWRKNIGKAVSWLFELLEDTGVQADGDLAAFIGLENPVDSEHITLFRAHDHTWIGLLKDSIHTATFAITASDCLEFPYPRIPGQRCRFRSTTHMQKSVLETMIAPTPDINGPQSSRWIENYHKDDYLPLDSSRKEMLKLLKHLPDKSAAFRWSDTAYFQAVALRLAMDKRCAGFQEYFGDGTHQSRMARTAFIVSKRHEDLPTVRRRRQRISSLARPQNEVMEDADSPDIQSTADSSEGSFDASVSVQPDEISEEFAAEPGQRYSSPNISSSYGMTEGGSAEESAIGRKVNGFDSHGSMGIGYEPSRSIELPYRPIQDSPLKRCDYKIVPKHSQAAEVSICGASKVTLTARAAESR